MTQSQYVKIDDQFVRDTESMIIINSDTRRYSEIVAQRKANDISHDITYLQQQYNNLVNEIVEIKTMLTQIIGRKDG
jgi:hypothetical protein